MFFLCENVRLACFELKPNQAVVRSIPYDMSSVRKKQQNLTNIANYEKLSALMDACLFKKEHRKNSKSSDPQKLRAVKKIQHDIS